MKKIIFIILFFLLFYTRFVGLNWGLPYPMHPDERNMAVSLEQLKCNFKSLKECLNPHFFAYGQFPLYLGYFLIRLYQFLTLNIGKAVTFAESAISLRIISAGASVINVIVLIKLINLILLKKTNQNYKYITLIISLLFFIFSPFFIQFSHFGTTESLLTLFYSMIIFFSLQLFNQLKQRTIFFLSLFSGLAIATKVSSVIFIFVPIISIILSFKLKKIKKIKLVLCYMLHVIRYTFLFLFLSAFFFLFFSPHNFLNFKEFAGSMNYESAVALGKTKVFYTRQFEYAVPILFQLTKIFPYALGWPQYILTILGFFLLSWRKKEINLLRFAFLAYFIPNALLYAKWTRFMAPIFPITSIFAVLFLILIFQKLFQKNKFLIFKFLFIFLFFVFSSLPGLAYLSIYQNPDVRFTASDWIYKNIPANSYLLFDTANVIDVPIKPPNYLSAQAGQSPVTNHQMVSFNFYDLDEDQKLQEDLKQHLVKADYIFVPSRRVFMNHTCYTYQNSKLQVLFIVKKLLNDVSKCTQLFLKYPKTYNYYRNLFSGELGFVKVAEFNSYPKISLFGRTLLEFPDEQAEETWSVFDHPVIRIYKKV